MDADIGVIGVGTMGSMAMWQLAKRGASVVGFEQYGVGHGRSAAGGETRIFRSVYSSGLEYIPILKDAHELWLQLQLETGNQLYTKTNGLSIGKPDLINMQNILASIEEFQLDHEILSFEESMKRFPQHRLLPDEFVIVDKQAGFLRPEYSIVSAVQRAEDLGAVLHRYTRVEEVRAESNGVIVRANGVEYKFGQVLITTGPWAREFLPEFEQQIEIRKVLSTWYSTKNINLFTPDQFPVFERKTNDVSFYGFPTVDGASIKIGVSTENEKIALPNELNKEIELEKLFAISQIIREYLPDLYPDPIRVSAYMDAYSPDDHFIVGRLPHNNNIVVACGFSGHGFKMAPAIGKITADILLDNRTSCSIEHFSPNRLVSVS